MNNGCTKCLVGCIRCCLDCFDRFIRYINRNAYIYCALTGSSYCTSALNSFVLILKNAAKFGFVEGIAGCFMFIAKFFIAIMTTLVSYFLLGAMVKQTYPHSARLGIGVRGGGSLSSVAAAVRARLKLPAGPTLRASPVASRFYRI